ARYETIRREVVVEPPRYVEEAVPAVYETHVIRTLVTPAQERRVAVPAIYTTIEKEVVIGGGEIRWAEVLCASNTDRYKVAEIQGALTDAGYPTLIDGAFGPRTLRAMEAFQRSRGMAVGYMTVETAEALGIDPYGPPPPTVYALLGGSPPPVDEDDQV
ncbi:MAG: peptidoglycan-binding protein, partial [Hyphomonadaceae bacterium]|nr:peptidoglycan-binding protein [Hyphomonadaceae bacterium]